MMDESHVRAAAGEIAQEIIDAARATGDDDPIAWVTGNSCFPPLRWCSAAEDVWQHNDGEFWQFLCDLVDTALARADVFMEAGPDGSLYAVDTARWEFTDEDDTSETISGQWTLISEIEGGDGDGSLLRAYRLDCHGAEGPAP
jgi:hypothetical protein